MILFLLFLTGLISGRIAAVWGCRLVDDTTNAGLIRCHACNLTHSLTRQLVGLPGQRCPCCGVLGRMWPQVTAVLTGLLFAAYGHSLLIEGCQTVSEVRPSSPLWQNRLPFHLLFLFLLLIVTITDLLDYSISDLIIGLGVGIAIILAGFSGELQMIHIWVRWDNLMVDLYGPYLPEWMKHHQHLHGIAWSTAGMLTGSLLIWVVRIIAHGILGYQAIGFGDVTLMAMIGAFIGWQPVLCTLALAPIAGILLGTTLRLITGRSFVAFGPHLAFAAVTVLFSWRYLWEDLRFRNIFSHWPTIAGLVGGTLAGISILLLGIRIFRMVPVDRIRS